jgi:hypothetical protein
MTEFEIENLKDGRWALTNRDRYRIGDRLVCLYSSLFQARTHTLGLARLRTQSICHSQAARPALSRKFSIELSVAKF